jgi:uncharacterized protein YfaT (DUF1175 family)
MAIEQTLGGKYIFFAKKGNKYVVIHGDDFEMYYTNERPVTDQELRLLERELQNVRREIGFLNAFY